MNRALQWKLIGGFILVFIAGGITGAFFGGLHARHLFFEFHHPELIAARMKERLQTELNLTPEQVAKISPIVDKTAAQLKQIRRDTGRRVHQIMTEAQPFIEKDLFALDFCTPADKEIAQLGCVVIASERGVEREKHFSTGGEVLLQITQKKIPF